jgi:hypothetical protein
MIVSTIELEDGENVRRINNGAGSTTSNFYKLRFVRSHIVQGTTNTIPNTAPTPAQVLTANNSLDTDLNAYFASNFAYGSDWLTSVTPRYICYESNRDLMNAAGASVTYIHAQVDVYEIVKSTGNQMAF